MDTDSDKDSATTVLIFDESVEEDTGPLSACSNRFCGIFFNAKTYDLKVAGRFDIKYTLSMRLVFSMMGLIGYILFGPLFGPPAGFGFSTMPIALSIFVLLIHINDWRQKVLPWALRFFGVIWALIPLTFYYFPAPGRWEPFNLPYEHMFAAIFVCLGWMIFRAGRDPVRSILVIDFLWLQGFLHGASMWYDAFREGPHAYRHFACCGGGGGDASLFVIVGWIYLVLRPDVSYYPLITKSRGNSSESRRYKESVCCCCPGVSPFVWNVVELLLFLAIGIWVFVVDFFFLTAPPSAPFIPIT